jgi:quinol monooxygenase YgiN
MIIVAGHLRVASPNRDRFLAQSREAVELARTARGCHDFVIAADLVDPERVNVYERWKDRAALHAFRGGGPNDELRAMVLAAEVEEFEVAEAHER